MADVPFSQFTTPSGGFVAEFVSDVIAVNSGAGPGSIITYTPPAGKRAAFLLLISQTGSNSNISVKSGSTAILSGKSLSNVAAAIAPGGSFIVGTFAGSSSAMWSLDKVVGLQQGQAISVEIASAASTQTIYYVYAYGA